MCRLTLLVWLGICVLFRVDNQTLFFTEFLPFYFIGQKGGLCRLNICWRFHAVKRIVTVGNRCYTIHLRVLLAMFLEDVFRKLIVFEERGWFANLGFALHDILTLVHWYLEATMRVYLIFLLLPMALSRINVFVIIGISISRVMFILGAAKLNVLFLLIAFHVASMDS